MIYLDNAATTKVSQSVLDAMLPYLQNDFGNAGSLHKLGRNALSAVNKARNQVASFIGAQPDNIIFTSGGTEANNLVFAGLADYLLRVGKTHIIVSAIEHDSVLNSAKMLIKRGFDVTIIPVKRDGKIDLNELTGMIKPNTGLISIMYVNNEIGSKNDVNSIGDICRKNDILFHTDCVQAAGFERINVEEIQCDLATISSHKIYGCKGSGALYVRDKSLISPILYGGEEQEFGIRGGTENVPGIVGFGQACEDAEINLCWNKDIICRLNKIFLDRLSNGVDFDVNSPGFESKVLSIRFDNVDAQTLMFALDARGVWVSVGSACRSHETTPSHVLTGIGLSDEEAGSSVRISISHNNTEDEIIRAADIIASTVMSFGGG